MRQSLLTIKIFTFLSFLFVNFLYGRAIFLLDANK